MQIFWDEPQAATLMIFLFFDHSVLNCFTLQVESQVLKKTGV